MPHTLSNRKLEVYLDLPLENYNRARFDWTGKVVRLDYQGTPLLGSEVPTPVVGDFTGKGLYNEFGIKTPVGYDELPPGSWFHKIGVGLLQRDDSPYNFLKDYPIQPAEFAVTAGKKSLQITCQGPEVNGYAYTLVKDIHLSDNGLDIHYALTNTGSKRILTTEYTHNFLAIDKVPIGTDYQLHYPFLLDQSVFDEYINPEGMITFSGQKIGMTAKPTKAFFFSDLTGGKKVPAKWVLENHAAGIAIAETGDFLTSAVHLWGAGHVISPELYIDVDIQPGMTRKWVRTYQVYQLNPTD